MGLLLGGAFRVAVIVFRKAEGKWGGGAGKSLTGLLRSVI